MNNCTRVFKPLLAAHLSGCLCWKIHFSFNNIYIPCRMWAFSNPLNIFGGDNKNPCITLQITAPSMQTTPSPSRHTGGKGYSCSREQPWFTSVTAERVQAMGQRLWEPSRHSSIGSKHQVRVTAGTGRADIPYGDRLGELGFSPSS